MTHSEYMLSIRLLDSARDLRVKLWLLRMSRSASLKTKRDGKLPLARHGGCA